VSDHHAWLQRFFAAHPQYTNEQRYQEAAVVLLRNLGCTHVTPEAEITPRMRVDVAAVLPDQCGFVYVECKNFERTISNYVDAVMQAASYADAIKHPVFIGPFDGSRTTLCNGAIDDGMSVLHLMAGRLNVGYLAVSDSGGVQLILRGQVIFSTFSGAHSDFQNLYKYVTRVGSKQVKA